MKAIKKIILSVWLVLYTLDCFSQAASLGAPRNQAFLGVETYVTMPLRKLANAQLLYVDEETLMARGIAVSQVLEKFGFAAPVDGEFNSSYLELSKTAYVDGNGGIGLNDNFGSGRAATIETDWQIKGSGRTPLVNPNADSYHKNGAAVLAEGIHEAIWSQLLARELPHGAYKVTAIIATGSTVSSGGHEGQPRVLIIREDPLRPGHYVINPTAEAMNDARDRVRISAAMKHLVAALPQPRGSVPQGESAQFRSGIFEFIDLQAAQHGYSWAHSLFHGGTSPTNAGMDGRMLDFGTFSAFDGYPKARVIDEDGFMGDTSLYKRDLLKNIRDSWVKTLSPSLLAALPTEEEWFERFEQTFQKTRQKEMLRLAGAFSELTEQLWKREEGRELAILILQLAEAGNDKEIEIWRGESPFGGGTYNLKRILSAAASMDLRNLNSDNSHLKSLIADESTRKNFVKKYSALFNLQKTLASGFGIRSSAEAEYRRLASRIRNTKMSSLFHIERNEKQIWKIVNDFKAGRSASTIQGYIDQVVNENRRDFRDTPPFTIVIKQNKVGQNMIREIFDARTNQKVELSIPSKFNGKQGQFRCEQIFL